MKICKCDENSVTKFLLWIYTFYILGPITNPSELVNIYTTRYWLKIKVPSSNGEFLHKRCQNMLQPQE